MNDRLETIVALSLVEGFGPVAWKRLITEFGSAEAFFDADRESFDLFFKSLKLPASAYQALRSKDLFKRAAEEIAECQKQGVAILTLEDAQYPESLKQIYAPPFVLYVKGSLPDEVSPRIAIVGSRNASIYGQRAAETIAQDLAQAGVVVVSGLAIGIDASAHRGAVKAQGVTLGVLAGGLARVYPVQNRKLAQAMLESGGALISEYPVRMLPRPGYFPIRNRIISGLSRAVIVIEAHTKSGALITADSALEEGREVFAVPGNVDSLRSQGSNALLKEGAKLITSAQDVLDELGLRKPAESKAPALSAARLLDPERKIFETIQRSRENVHLDEIAEKTRLQASEVSGALTRLVLQGYVNELPGKYFTGKIRRRA